MEERRVVCQISLRILTVIVSNVQGRNQFTTKELAIRSHSVEENNKSFSSIITLSGSSAATSEDDSIPIRFGPTRVISDQNIMGNRRAIFFPPKKITILGHR